MEELVREIIEKELAKGTGLVIVDRTSGYSEPGYSDPKFVVVVATSDLPKVLFRGQEYDFEDAVEAAGGEMVFYDEWTICHECGKLVRTQPDSHWWKPAYHLSEKLGVICHKCVETDPAEVVEEFFGRNEPIDFNVDLEKLGFVKVGECGPDKSNLSEQVYKDEGNGIYSVWKKDSSEED